MFNKNLRYYRLKNNLSMKELASKVGVTTMAISYYESGERKPNMETIKALAEALGIRVADFLGSRNTNLCFVHGEFRKGSKLSMRQQDFICESVEEYFSRFFTTVEILGGEVLPKAPASHGLKLSKSIEENGLAMRRYLQIAEFGPVGNLVELLENKGILVYMAEFENEDFSGMNGLVNCRPYIVINQAMSPERIRSTIAHEMAHVIFFWPEEMPDKQIENMANAISGAFLFPAEDAKRELGIRRTAITKDMMLTCREYGISRRLLVKRANLCGIVNDYTAKEFYKKAACTDQKNQEEVRIEKEEPLFFMQLVFRAVSEKEITVQKGAELLKKPYTFVMENCFAEEG